MVKSSFRKGRSSKLIDPVETQKTLLKHHEAANYRHFSLNDEYSQREGSITAIFILYSIRK